MIFRSIFFYLLLGFWTILMGILCLPYLILPSDYLNKPSKNYGFQEYLFY